jgi:hypothetical protein
VPSVLNKRFDTIPFDKLLHLAGIAKDNSLFHLRKYRDTGDRYYLGCFKAYYRIYKRLKDLETTSDNLPTAE